MKIRTQYKLTIAIFGALVFIIFVLMIATHLKIKQLHKQSDLASKIETDVQHITYLSDEYLIYHESQYLQRWESKYASISADLANLQVESPDKKVLLDHFKTNLRRVKEVFVDVVSSLDNTSKIWNGQAYAAHYRTLWSRMGVQNQEMGFAASGLMRLINDEEARLNQTNTMLIICLIGACGIYIGASNHLLFRRTLKSISCLQTGTKIIGSGNLEYSIEENTDDEIGELCCAFNEMTGKLGRSHKILEVEIAERKRTEEVLQQSEEQFRTLANAIPQLCWMANADGWIFWYNQRWYEYTGTTPEQMEGWGWQSAHDPEILPQVLERWKASISSARPFEMVFPLRGSDGVFRPFLTRVMPVGDKDGKIVRWCGTNTDITERIQAEEAKAKLAALVESSDDAIISKNLSGTILSWNIGSERLFGYRADEVMGKPVTLLIPPEYQEEEEQILVRMMSGERVDHFETVRLAKDGRRIEVSVTASPIIDSQGHIIGASKIVRDITERKQAEERLQASLLEKDVLLKEIHHRVKNNLQVISSLVSLQARGSEDETVREVLKDVSYRVHSMALVHEKLYQSPDLARIDFAEYIRGLLSFLWRAHGATAASVRLTFNLEPVPLPVDTAVPCGLILNELAGNALKHAFRGRDEGEVTVSLKNGADGRIRMSVADNGVGLPEGLDWRQANSLGLRLVQMLSRQLDAEVEVCSRVETKFEIVFQAKG